ncbi:hypothetical protein [Hyphomicrobium facile]|uniref:Uncharacterized protein n=1 Tax=Hyphomicrobium facile TaxID=51670 RepID=A0A1I7MX17_9HYPH|nr:hypothetical protein [Hyphomicrobium facile]SFV26908.1 hypothetical protein SAMN04488557_0628 [Hyphomicrobium facile]
MTYESIAVSNNEPAELFDARSRIARLEAKLEQADYLIAEALESAVDYEDMIRKLQMAQQTLKEALSQQSDLMRA